MPSKTYIDQSLGASEVMYKPRKEIRGNVGRRRKENLLLLIKKDE